MKSKFIGRKDELKLLSSLFAKNTASLVVVYGRRRIGKSRLIEEFGKQRKFFSFAGLYPEKNTTTQHQLQAFYKRFKEQFDVAVEPFSDWSDAFYHLAKQTRKENVVILFDEISWMGSGDINFLGKLKNAWDLEFKKNVNLVLVLCGSVSIWIEKNLLSHKGFYGRFSLKLKLSELSLPESNQFWNLQKGMVSSYEKLKILSVIGGVPKYLEEIIPVHSADENIKRLCFSPSGLLYNDYDYIFSSMLERESNLYQQIIEFLCNKRLQREEILNALNKKSGGIITNYIDELESSGFIARDFTWGLKTGKISKLSQYRISDNYIRFYIKYILPSLHQIRLGKFSNHSLNALPGWASIMGLQVENLVLNNRDLIRRHMDVYADDVICDGPFFQRKTTRHHGCQIDYLVQTKLGVLYVAEIKFSRKLIRKDINDEVANKIKNLTVPKNTSIVPVLIHVGDIHDDVIDSQYFGKIIDLSILLD